MAKALLNPKKLEAFIKEKLWGSEHQKQLEDF